jgi:hypothetical protein
MIRSCRASRAVDLQAPDERWSEDSGAIMQSLGIGLSKICPPEQKTCKQTNRCALRAILMLPRRLRALGTNGNLVIGVVPGPAFTRKCLRDQTPNAGLEFQPGTVGCLVVHAFRARSRERARGRG